MKKILLINANPVKGSFCEALADRYQSGAIQSGAQCVRINLIDLQFDPILKNGYHKRMDLEPDLLRVQQEILTADHLVFVYPNWWSTYPALLKGFIDRTFLPGFAFRYRDNSPFWDKLLKGKSARILVTMDSPRWYYSLFNKKPGHNSLRIGVLQFSGIHPVHITSFSPIKSSTEKQRNQWLSSAEQLGRKEGRG
ncbi:MAG: NAD(P)H-dependent oxidoreductase [Marinilabiliales bacterium]|nr:NAD(P)H-dependent oxidoreductase [Marinilabiliales bacterium]